MKRCHGLRVQGLPARLRWRNQLFFFFLLGPQTASCEDCVWKVSLIRLYTKIQRVLKTQITSGVLGNVISSYRNVKRSWWAPSYVRRSWAPRSRVQLPGPDPALLLVLRRDVMSAWMAGIKGFTVCMKWTEETPYSHSGSKNGCASGPQLVHPHRSRKESSRDFLTKFPAPERTKNAERLFLRPT